MPTPINNSANISSLDSKIVADLCAGNFYVDVSPSVWIGTGYNNVQGASTQITNPVGIIFKNYPTSGFDILPPMTSVVSTPIPTIAGNYQYGTYTVAVRLTDSNGNYWVITKNVNICPPDSNNKTKSEGCLNASIKGNCQSGKVIIILNQPPTYKGTISTSQTNTLVLQYPTESGLPVFNTTIAAFAVQLFEGQYILTGSICALYNYGDNVFFNIKYKIKCEKIIKCIIDECCVFEKLDELNLQIQTDCTQDQKDKTSSIIVNALWLKNLAELAGNCGNDPSDYISQLEDLLGCTCTCNCNDGTPIIGNVPISGLQDFVYRGLLSQSGSADPVAVIGTGNSITISWTRQSPGKYLGTLIGTFTPLTITNTFSIVSFGLYALSGAGVGYFVKSGYNSPNSILVVTEDETNNPVDNLLINCPIELSILS